MLQKILQLKKYFDGNQKFPILVINKGAKSRIWVCWVDDNVIYRTDGDPNGKIKEPSQREVEENTLRSAQEQAVLEAERLWIQQVTKDYKPYENDKQGMKIFDHVQNQREQNGGMTRGVKMFGVSEIKTDTTIGKKSLINHYPMLAKKYKDFKNDDLVLTNQALKLQFPVYVQPKVDGVRALPHIVNGKIVLESRNGNAYMFLDHVKKELLSWLTKKNMTNIVLDGELYIHQLYHDFHENHGNHNHDGNHNDGYTHSYNSHELTGVERFQLISEICKITRSSKHIHEHFVEFWIYDIWDTTKTFKERLTVLNDLFKDYPGDIIKLLPTERVNSHAEIEEYMKTFVGENNNRQGYEYEGIMIRAATGAYTSKKDYHCDQLLKFKRFQDEEWTIVDAEENKGTQKGAIKWIVEKDGVQVNAQQIGQMDYCKKLYTKYTQHPEKFIGKSINIRFNEKTKDGKPRFPKATAIVLDKN